MHVLPRQFEFLPQAEESGGRFSINWGGETRSTGDQSAVKYDFVPNSNCR